MNASGTARLAIVIPAYKTKFLRASLQSIAGQTNRNFQLYVGDDASPEPVADIVREFSKILPLKYHRFDHNLGGTSLVQQWERCVRLSQEPWVWLFSDDDTMEPGCVAAFFDELEKSGGHHDLYRFNTIYANNAKKQLVENPPHPQNEAGSDFLLARLRGGRASTLQELIFSRQAWEASGGIPDFPMAWASDDAFIAKMGVHHPIRTISGPCVTWRLSDMNISNDNSLVTFRAKLEASVDFIRWAVDFLEHHQPADKKLEKAEVLKLTEHWFFHLIHEHSWRFLDLKACREIESLAVSVWGHKPGHGLIKALKLNAAHFKRKCVGRLKRRN